jgi:hypothetical protein
MRIGLALCAILLSGCLGDPVEVKVNNGTGTQQQVRLVATVTDEQGIRELKNETTEISAGSTMTWGFGRHRCSGDAVEFVAKVHLLNGTVTRLATTWGTSGCGPTWLQFNLDEDEIVAYGIFRD